MLAHTLVMMIMAVCFFLAALRTCHMQRHAFAICQSIQVVHAEVGEAVCYKLETTNNIMIRLILMRISGDLSGGKDDPMKDGLNLKYFKYILYMPT